AEVIIDEDRVGLIILLELLQDLASVADLVRHAETISRKIAEATAIVTAARGNKAGRREKAAPWQEIAPGAGLFTVRPEEIGAIDRPRSAGLDITKDLRPELDAFADGEDVGMWSRFVGTREN